MSTTTAATSPDSAPAERGTAGSARSAESARPAVPLRRNVNFQLLWSGSACAFIGMAAADVAFPLVILALTRSPAKAGAYASLVMAAMIVTTMPAGALIDKRDRRRMLMLAEGVRAVAFTSIAVTWYLGALTYWQLIGTALVLGAAQPFGAARMLMVRAVVPVEQLTSAVTQEQVRNSTAELVGPPIGGALFALSRALPFVFTAVMFVVSFTCAFFVKVPARPEKAPARPEAGVGTQSGPSGPATDDGVLAGLRVLFGDPFYRAVSITICLVNMVGVPLSLSLIVLLQDQSVGPGPIGAVLGGLAAGSLVGAALVKPLHRAMRPGWLLITTCVVFGATVGGVAVSRGPWIAGALLFASGLTIPSVVVMFDVLILRQVPDEVRGRTITAFQTVMGLGMPVGMLSAGFLLQYSSPTTTLVVAAAVVGVAALYSVSQRALRDAQWPAPASSPSSRPS